MVYLEECILGNRKGGFRAVKSMRKPTLLRPKDIDYGRELEAIALFSQQRVGQGLKSGMLVCVVLTAVDTVRPMLRQIPRMVRK